MPKTSSQWICQQCGYVSSGFLGRCPSCSSWASLVETKLDSSPQKAGRRFSLAEAVPVKLSEVQINKTFRTPTGINELDRVLGGGLVPGSVILLAGVPGIGKSTLLLQLAAAFNPKNSKVSPKTPNSKPVLYVSGEESAQQIALRASRLGLKTDCLQILTTTDSDAAISQITSAFSLVIIDSIQTMSTADLTGLSGSVGQIRESAFRFIQTAKAHQTPLIIVGHITKEGAIAGPKILEHMVDTVLYFEGERYQSLRLLRANKNRFGATDEVGVFSMEQNGLVEVTNPSQNLLSQNHSQVPGSVTTCIMEGTRPLLVEVQALVVSSQAFQPRRVASGFNWDRLQLLIAVLTKRAGIPLGGFDIFINVAGGIKITEPGADLAVCLSLASAYFDKPVPQVAVGEVGLLGEIRSVPQIDKRRLEAKRLGFSRFITPEKELYLSQIVTQLFRSSRSAKTA